MAKWWYGKNNQPMGPLEEEEFRRLIRSGEVRPESKVWRSGFEDWKPLAEADEFREELTRLPPPLPRESGPVREWKPAQGRGPDRAEKHEEAPPGPYKGARWRRFFARMLDAIVDSSILIAIMVPVGAVFIFSEPDIYGPLANDGYVYFMKNQSGLSGYIIGSLFQFLSIIVESGIYVLFGNTPGKALLGLRVVDSQGRRLSYGAYFWRTMALWVQGFGLHIPGLSLVTLIVQFFRLGKGKPASYDQASGHQVTVKSVGGHRIFIIVIIVVAVLILSAYLMNPKRLEEEGLVKNTPPSQPDPVALVASEEV